MSSIPATAPASSLAFDGPRVLLYSHDSYGLGHLRRTLTLAAALSESLPGAAVLVASGSPCATHFPLPPRVDIIKLPAVHKDEQGRYAARSLPGGIDLVLALRTDLLSRLFETFRPNLLVVDHQVIGLRGELRPALAAARRFGTATILGMPDIIDEPSVVASDLSAPEVRRALAEDYDRVCVYGCPEVFDSRIEYPIPPELGERLQFTGYVVRRAPHPGTRPLPHDRPQVLVTVGGGEDGGGRIESYLSCLELAPADWDSTIVLGPLLDPALARTLKRRSRLLDGVTVHGFHSDLPRLLAESHAVVAMAGYNTTAEILQSGVPAVLLPRTFPRKEQLLRADRLAGLGLVQSLPVAEPRVLRAAVETALSRPRRHNALPLDGDRQLCAVAADLLGAAAPSRAREALAS